MSYVTLKPYIIPIYVANNSKLLWSTINSILNRRDCQVLKEVKVDGEVLTGSVFC